MLQGGWMMPEKQYSFSSKKMHTKPWNLPKCFIQITVTRKEADSSITEEALAIINADENLINRKSSVVFKESWHKGVVGIVASQVDRTLLPAYGSPYQER